MLVQISMDHPRWVLWVAAALAGLAVLATFGVETDTDPENMLPASDEVRVRNAEMADAFGTHEMIVVGVVDDDGVTSPEVLGGLAELHRAIARFDGVVGSEVVSFTSAVGGEPTLGSDADAQAVVEAVADDPVLGGNVLSDDGTTAAIYVPLVDKSDANPVTAEITAAIEASPVLADRASHVAGLPLAEEAFGREMFVQMAIFAPLAGLLIFALMWWFFRRVSLVLAAMAVAMLSVVATMGALIGSGNTLHIMSSMIPIFLMPIAILDSVHVLSEFFDRYPHHLDRRATLRAVYAELHRPLTFTSLTTGVAFASLALTPIPPVQVFGIFVALGVLVAWLATLTLIPALVMRSDEVRLARAAASHPESEDPLLSGLLRRLGRSTVRHRGLVGASFVLLALAALPAVSRIEVNDNPVNWFKPGSDIRTATEELNERLPGTFTANLLLTGTDQGALTQPEMLDRLEGLERAWDETGLVGHAASYADLLTPTDPADAEAQLTEAGANPLTASLITEDQTVANVRLQLNDGDNQAMRRVVDTTEAYLDANPLPDGVTAEWAGETYLNLVWQDKMVTGMLAAFASTLAVVVLLMGVLFRSVRWAALSVLPVLWTVLVVYGALGLLGKDYDMPIAVLSTLVLGIGVDFAIHFVERFREYDEAFGDRRAALRAFFEEPARALTRNALVIAVGFTPLFLASLTPYLVVGAFLSSIIMLSWLATLLLLPAIVAGRSSEGSEPPATDEAERPPPALVAP